MPGLSDALHPAVRPLTSSHGPHRLVYPLGRSVAPPMAWRGLMRSTSNFFINGARAPRLRHLKVKPANPAIPLLRCYPRAPRHTHSRALHCVRLLGYASSSSDCDCLPSPRVPRPLLLTACQHQIVARSHYKELVEPKVTLVYVHVHMVTVVPHEQLSRYAWRLEPRAHDACTLLPSHSAALLCICLRLRTLDGRLTSARSPFGSLSNVHQVRPSLYVL